MIRRTASLPFKAQPARHTPPARHLKRLAHHSFHSWSPGQVYAPIPQTYIDLHEVYTSKLEAYVAKHSKLLATHLGVTPNPAKITRKLLTRPQTELNRVQAQRSEAPKKPVLNAERVRPLLRWMYRPDPPTAKILAALQILPGAERKDQLSWLDPAHVEQLISLAMTRPPLGVVVFPLVEASGLALTARERAKHALQTWQTTKHAGEAKRVLQTHWPAIAAAQDTGAFNVVLKLALQLRDAPLYALIGRHLVPDRFTYAIKLRDQSLPAAQAALGELVSRGFVVDTTLFSSLISKLLGSPHAAEVGAAEAEAETLVSHMPRGQKPLFASQNALATQLLAMDAASCCVVAHGGPPISLEPLVDEVLLHRLHQHYVATKQHAKAVDAAVRLAEIGEVPLRRVVRQHVRGEVPRPELERLFYLCCDINVVHPGFISDDLAQMWVTVMTKGGVALSEAREIVDANRRRS